jgi:hypothetical protein
MNQIVSKARDALEKDLSIRGNKNEIETKTGRDTLNNQFNPSFLQATGKQSTFLYQQLLFDKTMTNNTGNNVTFY